MANEFNLSDNAVSIFKKLYSFQGENIDDTFKRIAKEFSTNEEEYKVAYDLLAQGVWRPNTPVFMNAGTDDKIFSACFPKETKVRTLNGLKNIEDIQINDKVLSHTGKFREVCNTMKRKYTGDIYSINAVGIPNKSIKCTEEHPFLIIRKEDFVCERIKSTKCTPSSNGTRACCLKKKDSYKNDCEYIGNRNYKKIWIEAKDLKVGDYLTISFDDSVEVTEYIDISSFIHGYKIDESYIYYQNKNKINRYVKIDHDFMRLLGYYTAEGCSDDAGDIRFAFSMNEMDYCNDVKNIITKIFGKPPYFYECPDIGTRYVRLHSVVLSKLFRIICGETSTGKYLHKIITKSPHNLQKSFLIGLFRGDGFISSVNSIRITLANFNMIHQVWEMLMRCGMFFNFGYAHISKNTDWNYTQPFGLETTLNDPIKKQFAKETWNDILFAERKYNFDYSHKVDNHFIIPISSISKTKSDVDVYNIEVVDDHSYSIMNVNVHNCFVAGLEDSMDSIYDIANTARKIFQKGSGIGIPIGNLREKDSWIFEKNPEKPPEGKSSGPVCFMDLYNSVGETTKSGGRTRRAAIMCCMHIWHPDIIDFIKCKNMDKKLNNMNISVMITDKFIQALKDDISYPLVSPNKGTYINDIRASDVWNELCMSSHKSAEPGIIFIDEIQRMNPLKSKFLIEATNPCGEQPLLPFECCSLSAINTVKFVKDTEFDYDGLYKTAKDVTRLMDNIIDIANYPDERFEDMSKKYRSIGVGLMGLSDTLQKMKIPYASRNGRSIASNIMRTITTACIDESANLAKEKGKFHDYKSFKDDVEQVVEELTDNNKEVLEKVRKYGLRHSRHTTIAPTGTTSISCDTSYGMEPCFGLVFKKKLHGGGEMLFTNSNFYDICKDEKWYNEDLLHKIVENGGSLKGIHGIPKTIKDIFVVAHDIGYKDRIDMQAALQRYTSAGISSTINLPKDTTKEDISDLFKYAYESKLKGITIYRDGSRKNQPVETREDKKETKRFKRPKRLPSNNYMVETGEGKMYISVSEYNNKPIELFINIGKGGQSINNFSEAIGRLISIMLQKGIQINDITDSLIGINSDKPTWYRFEETDQKPNQILSIPDGIAQLLKRYYEKNGDASVENGDYCPECKQKGLKNIEGCSTCYLCGYSKCA